jgi:hypothetical protein
MVTSMRILGVLPLAGSGVRLGAEFHKSLMPFPVEGNTELRPIVDFSIERLKLVSDEIVAVLSSESIHAFPAERFDVTPLHKTQQGEASSSVSFAAEYAVNNEFSHIAVSLPDTFWEPLDGFVSLRNHLLTRSIDNLDGVLGLFLGDPTMLDQVVMDAEHNVSQISTRSGNSDESQRGWGWGCFILSAEKAKAFSDDCSWAENLMKSKVSGLKLPGRYFDIGSPPRYINALKSVLL